VLKQKLGYKNLAKEPIKKGNNDLRRISKRN